MAMATSIQTGMHYPLFNLAWKDAFHADGKFNSLEAECLDPIQAPNQMAEEIGNVLTKLRRDPHTLNMFKAAFGTEEITIERMEKALAQFTCINDHGQFKIRPGEKR
jgi:cytochrome c peroxidase